MRSAYEYILLILASALLVSSEVPAQGTPERPPARVTKLKGFAAIQTRGRLLWRDLLESGELRIGDRVRTDVASDIGVTFFGAGRVLAASVSYFEMAGLPAKDGTGLAGVKNLYGTVLMVPPRDSLSFRTYLIIAQTDTIVGREGMFTCTTTDEGQVIVNAVTGSVILRRGSSGRTIDLSAPGKLTFSPGAPEGEASDLDPADIQAIGAWADGGPAWKPGETAEVGRATWAYFLERQKEVWQRDPQIYLRLYGSFSEAVGEFILWNGVRGAEQTEAGKGYFFIQDEKAVVEVKGVVP